MGQKARYLLCLEQRWSALLAAPNRSEAFRETSARNMDATPKSIDGASRLPPLADSRKGDPSPRIVRYAYRFLDRQWTFDDPRFADRPRPELWRSLSEPQLFLTTIVKEVLGRGPAAIVTNAIPDLHHFSGRGAKDVIPLYKTADGVPNATAALLDVLGDRLGLRVGPEDLFAYAYTILSSPRYVERFFGELQVPGPRLPITTDPELFQRAVEKGKWLIWLHTFGERMTSAERGRAAIPAGTAKLIEPVGDREEDMPEEFEYDPGAKEIRIGKGRVGPVEPEVWDYSVSGWQVVRNWLRFRMREGAGRARSSTSPLDRIRPKTWPAEYTVELLEILAVLEHTIAQQPEQAKLVDAICDSDLIPANDLPQPTPAERKPPSTSEETSDGKLF